MAAPSSAGKTTFICKFLKELEYLVDRKIVEILYFIPPGRRTKPIDVNASTIVHEGLPEIEFFDSLDCNTNRLLVIDDFAYEKKEIEKITTIFTRISHHCNMSVFFVTQNLFEKNLRTISLNAHYLVLFRNMRDANQIKILGKQIFPDDSGFLVDAYGDATSEPYGYLVIDLSQNCDNLLRLRTNIFFSDRGKNFAYITRKKHFNCRKILNVE